jgi:hypothetical protein
LQRGCLTLSEKSDDNRANVEPLLKRIVASSILAPYAALSLAIAPEHLHEADADHPHSAIHRHVQPHEAGSRDHDHDHAQLSDDDDHVVWLDAATLHEVAFLFVAPAAPPNDRIELVAPAATWVARPDYNVAPPHGPPRASLSLRAPPSLSA